LTASAVPAGADAGAGAGADAGAERLTLEFLYYIIIKLSKKRCASSSAG
jgi:hypothetical protein